MSSEPPTKPPSAAATSGATAASATGAGSASSAAGVGSAGAGSKSPSPPTPPQPKVVPEPGKPLIGHAPPKPLPPLEGWRGVLQYTGLPRGLLTWKPKPPGPKMSVFLGVVTTLSLLYYDDRKKAKAIRDEYIAKVQHLSEQPMRTSLEEPRRVLVYSARWPEDDDMHRATQYFRKYVKPYLVAAAIDYKIVEAPLYGSIARIVRSDTLRKRREALGLQALEQGPDLGIPQVVAEANAKSENERWLEGGVVLVGRPALKEYLAGLRAGWRNGVEQWEWEKDIEKAIEHDGVFEAFKEPETAPAATTPAAPATPQQSSSSLSFLRRGQPTPPATATTAQSAIPSAPPATPSHLHAQPDVLPPHPPLLLVPWTNYIGFAQIPQQIYSFFTERVRTREGAEAAYALITNQTRAFEPPLSAREEQEGNKPELARELPPDTDFGLDGENYYKNAYFRVPKLQAEQRRAYYKTLAERLEAARQFARGERDLTDEEKRSDKPITTEDDLRAERRKRELRWHGGREGWAIVHPDTPIAWDPAFAGWLRVFDAHTADELAQAQAKRAAAMEKEE